MAAGEAESADLRVAFDRRLKLEFHGSKVTSDAGLLAFRELDDALGLTEMAGQVLAGSGTGKNNRHPLTAQFRQSVFSRLAGYGDVNDADRLSRSPVLDRRRSSDNQEAASTSRMGRFETGVLTGRANLTALEDLSGSGSTRFTPAARNVVVLVAGQQRRPATHGDQEGTA